MWRGDIRIRADHTIFERRTPVRASAVKRKRTDAVRVIQCQSSAMKHLSFLDGLYLVRRRPSRGLSMCSEPVPSDLVALSIRLADAASEAIRPFYRSIGSLQASSKQDESPVTAADRAAEEAMRKILATEVPDHAVLGEEFGKTTSENSSDYTWVLDPIDGTKAFMIGKPTFGTLIALLRSSEPVIGIIDQPISRERWMAVEGSGLTLNGTPAKIATAAPERLSEAVLHATHPDMFTGILRMAFEELSASCRYTLYGCDCYAYALLAMGNVHVICEADMKPWDYMALVPVIQEAGGVITDWRGQDLGLRSDGTVLAAVSRELHEEALELLRLSPRGLLLLQERDERLGLEEQLEELGDGFPTDPAAEAGVSSMTGFGSASAARDNISVNVEIKSVNSRYCDVSIKAPRAVTANEVELSSLVRQELIRGKVLVSIEVKDKEQPVLPIQVDADAVRAARRLLDEVQAASETSQAPTLDNILRFSEVFVKRDNSESKDQVLVLVEHALKLALEDIKKCRRREGYVLQLDLLRRSRKIADTCEEISLRAPSILQREKESFRRVLEEAVQQGIVTANGNLGLYPELVSAGRVDISEELVRLKSHLSIFQKSMFTTRPVGQKLNFLVQELNREATTISNKVNDAPVSQLCVLIKEEVEKMREQVQNAV